MPDYDKLNEYEKITYVATYMEFVIGIIGLVGNVVVVFIFSRQSLRKYSYSFYSRGKTIADSLFIAFSLRNWTRYVYGIDIQLANQFSCVFWGYGDYVVGTIGQFFLLLTSIDRVVLIVYPNRFQIFRKKWFQITLALIAVGYSLLVNILLALNSFLIDIPLGGNQTMKMCIMPSNIITIQAWIILIHVLGMVLAANSLLNFKLFLFIRSSRNKVASYANSTNINNNNNNAANLKTQKNDRRFAVASIGQSLITFVFKFTSGILHTTAITSNFSLDKYIMIFTLVIMIFIIDGAVTFFVNIAINAVFRDEFLAVLGWQKKSVPVSSSTTKKKIVSATTSTTKN